MYRTQLVHNSVYLYYNTHSTHSYIHHTKLYYVPHIQDITNELGASANIIVSSAYPTGNPGISGKVTTTTGAATGGGGKSGKTDLKIPKGNIPTRKQ